MVLDASRFSTSTATLAAAPAGVTSADPWDAPYFGGPVYFEYRPTLAAVTDAHEGGAAGASDDAARVVETKMERTSALAADPWDAPYFGGPVYLEYRPERLASVSEDVKPAVAVGMGVSLVFAPWDAPYFGGPVYFEYAGSGVKAVDLAAIETTETGRGGDAAIVARAEMEEMDGREHVVAAVSSEGDGVLPVAGVSQGGDGKQRGWVTRLFGRELYIGRRV